MTEKDLEIQEHRRANKRLQALYDHMMQSETFQYYAKKNVNGEYVHDIASLDRGIKNLHARCRKAEEEAQACMAEAMYYRRKFEALEMERKEDEENRFPLFKFDHRANENQHPQASV